MGDHDGSPGLVILDVGIESFLHLAVPFSSVHFRPTTQPGDEQSFVATMLEFTSLLDTGVRVVLNVVDILEPPCPQAHLDGHMYKAAAKHTALVTRQSEDIQTTGVAYSNQKYP